MSDTHKIVPSEVVAIEQIEMHPLVALAMDKHGDISVEKLEKLTALQERHEARSAKKEYDAAMLTLKKDLPIYIGHDTKVSFSNTKYTHTSLAKAVEEIVPHLNKYGFVHSWIVTNEERSVTVVCRLTHTGGHSVESKLIGPPDEKGSKSKGQAIASTITLLSRYTFLSLLGVATKDMRETDPRTSSPEPVDPESIDENKNVSAVTFMRGEGVSLEAAQEHVQKDVRNWTAGDLASLSELVKSKRRERGE